MRQVTITAVLILITLLAKAQRSKRINLTIKVGVTAAHYSLPKDYAFNTSYIDAGKTQHFQAGVLVNIPFSKQLDVQTGLLLSGKGGKVSISQPVYYWEDSDTKSLYLEMPVNIVYNIPITKAINLHLGTGLYLAVGIGGKSSYQGTIGDFFPQHFKEERKIKYNHRDAGSRGMYSVLNKYDYGMNFMSSVSIKQVQVYCNYGHGFKDVHPNGEGNSYDMGKNRALTVGLGYTFKW